MCKNLIKISILIVFVATNLFANNDYVIDLSGEWNFSLDKENVGISEKWNTKTLKQTIKLPGSTDEAQYGKKTVGSDYGILTREYKYIGPAWYQKTIFIPKKWKNNNITLFLERVLWESKVYIDDREIDTKDALATPHYYHLGKLKPGDHTLTIRINNEMIHNIGDKGHGYGEYTQSIWNGIIGRMELQARPDIYFDNVRIFPEASSRQVKLDIEFAGNLNSDYQIKAKVFDNSTGKKVASIKSSKGNFTIPIKNKVKLWDEFLPNLYSLELVLKANGEKDQYLTNFGFRTVETTKSHVIINGEPTFLRGNLDCVHFPLTGYPSTDVKEWRRIFQVYKDNGLNHVRFHSWCPPEAAFVAADELGIYIQAEASLWIDWWMGRTKEESKERPEMYTQGEPKGLGKDNPSATKFIEAEINRVIDRFGNHPSFIMFCIGNELGNSDFDLMGNWMKEAKEKDPRRIYAASTARTVTENCEYSVTHYYPEIGGVRQRMHNHNNWDYEKNYAKTPVPTIAHEIGQWPVYPLWSEIDKYTGTLKARNLMEFRETAKANGLYDQNEDLHQASGQLSLLLYKDEIESFLRTPSCAGIQLLSMQDYQGQGEALIGWLDCFYESKGLTTPEEVRQFHCETVPLVKMDSYIYQDDDEFHADVLLHHFGPKELKNQKILWQLTNSSGKILQTGQFDAKSYATKKLHPIGEINTQLPNLDTAEKLTLSLEVQNTSYRNKWNIWVYPKDLTIEKNDVLVTEKLNNNIIDDLENGQKILLIANNCGDPKNTKYAAWRSLYWSASFFPGQSIETIGLLLDNNHPAFADFPTEMHSDWQWWNICRGAHGFVLDEFPKEYRPIAQPVSDFHYNHKLGGIFEVKYGKGKLLVCGYDLSRERLPEVKQLKYSLANYMHSNEFKPDYEVNRDFLSTTLKSYQKASVEVPEGFESSTFYVKAAANLTQNGNSVWQKKTDDIIIAKGFDYQVSAAGIWKDDNGTAWHGKNIDIKINTPEGVKGNLYVHYHDWNNQNRDGIINFEGRDYRLGKHTGDGIWIKLNVMREDTNDGKIILRNKCTKGGNLMITKIAFIPTD